MNTQPRVNPEQSTILVSELIDIFRSRGYIIESAMFTAGFQTPPAVANLKYGDLKERIPEVIGFDPAGRRVVFGMACSGENELGSDETLTKFNVFLNHPVGKNEKPALLFLIVPASKVVEATDIVTHALHPEYWPSLQIVSSMKVR